MRATEGHFLIIMDSIQQEDIPFLSVYVPNYRVSKHETKTDRTERIRQIHNYSCRINTSFLATVRTSK